MTDPDLRVLGYAQSPKEYKLWDFGTDIAVVSHQVMYDDAKSKGSKQAGEQSISDEIQFENDLKYVEMFQNGDQSRTASSPGNLAWSRAVTTLLPSEQASPTPAQGSSMDLQGKYTHQKQPPREW